MLVLSRYPEERILIGKDIQIVIISVEGKKVKVGIIAPPEIPVHREEVVRDIAKEVKLLTKMETSRALPPLCQ